MNIRLLAFAMLLTFAVPALAEGEQPADGPAPADQPAPPVQNRGDKATQPNDRKAAAGTRERRESHRGIRRQKGETVPGLEPEHGGGGNNGGGDGRTRPHGGPGRR